WPSTTSCFASKSNWAARPAMPVARRSPTWPACRADGGTVKRWRWLGLLLLALFVALQVKLWIGDGGVRGIHALRQSVGAQKAENAELETRNQALAADVTDLKRGQNAVESRARNNLGLIKPGEVFYQVIDPAPATSGAEQPRDGD